jgi:2-methylcitrate dehydratase PrpD
MPFAIALAACNGVVVPKDFDRFPRGKALHDFMSRVHSYVDPELDALGDELAWTIVKVTLDNGRIIQMKANVAKGTPLKPFSEIELIHKFFQCALLSLEEQRAEQLLDRLWRLDELPDVANLFKADASRFDPADHSADHHH